MTLHRPRPTGPAAVAAASLLLLSACGSGDRTAGAAGTGSSTASGDRTVTVVASTDVWGDIASVVGGKDITVTSFIDDPSKDPHSFEADPRAQLAVSDADVVIENGGGYDDFMGTLRKASKTKAVLLDAVQISGKKPVDGQLNEHVFYDFPTVGRVADSLAAALGKASPSQAATFTANAAALRAQLAGMEKTEATIKASASGTGVAITEPVPGYLLEASGLVNKTPEAFSESIEEGTDVAPTVLADTEALFTRHAVKALVYNEQTTGAETEAVLKAAKANGIAVVPVTETLPKGQDYVSWMKTNLAAVQAAVAP